MNYPLKSKKTKNIMSLHTKQKKRQSLRWEFDRRIIFSKNVFCGATNPLRPPGILVYFYIKVAKFP